MRWILIACALAACEPAPAPTPTPTPTPTPPTVAPAPAPPPIDAAAPPDWELVLSADDGPCSTHDPRSCHQTWTVSSDGVIAKVALPNDDTKPPVKSSFTLTTAERDRLRGLVASAEFMDGMEHGFACQGESYDPDATLRLAYNREMVQYVEGCTRNFAGSGWDDAVAKQIVQLIRR